MSKVITNILLQDITPAYSEYDVLRKQLICMAAFLPSDLNTKSSNLLSSFWRKQNKLPLWDQLKMASIKIGMDYLGANQDDPQILVLYGLLADCRRITGKVLHQPHHSHFGKPRTKGGLRTPLGGPGVYRNPYAHFYSLLRNTFDTLPKVKTDDTTGSQHDIVLDDKIVTSIVYKEAKSGTADLFIEHLDVDKALYDLLNKYIQMEFKNYMQSMDSALIIQSVAKLVYYFTLATPLERGSAATAEMMTAALLWHKNIMVEYNATLTMDLTAFFSNGIEHFVEQYEKSLAPITNESSMSQFDAFNFNPDIFEWSDEEPDLTLVQSCHQM